jgi:hypothetical protein
MRYKQPELENGQDFDPDLVEDAERAVAGRQAIVGDLDDYITSVRSWTEGIC